MGSGRISPLDAGHIDSPILRPYAFRKVSMNVYGMTNVGLTLIVSDVVDKPVEALTFDFD